ncbi:hypothetical protein RM555_30010 [Micromonospora sp. DSM 115977]|uniref:Integral membrane protein n=1 Tax=Micromonospora reichwaldensis TaxID=3075516 RepID=A0ABU2X4W6_9ACTN|nr:hypothetical protein [Micromonospora sp. DSM 115977]MDT0533232.1 hypothetical protein [Micromonospora sp. DSM 115977]
MVHRVLELRVHGVSNTPPGQILGLRPAPGTDAPPPPWLVAGGPVTGFYRSPVAGPADPVAVEAYSWGQLTSGARTARDVERALWTLLLPFALANVALHARPSIPADARAERWNSTSGVTAWLIRLFCLSLTGTFALTLATVGVDLVGWQCVDDDCLRRIPGPWEFLGRGWWSEGARSLAVGLLVPLGVLALLGLVSWRTYQYEAQLPAEPDLPPSTPQPEGAPQPAGAPAGGRDRPGAGPATPEAPPGNPLQDRTFWTGEGQLRRGAVLHLCTGVVVAAAVPLGAVLAADPPRDVRAAVAWPTVAALTAVVLVAVVALARPGLTRRAGATPLGGWSVAVAVLTGVGLVGTVLVLLMPDGPAGTPLADLRPATDCARRPTAATCSADRSLPGLDWIVAWLGTGQLLLLIAIGSVARSGRRALATPAAAALLLPLGFAWFTGWLPGLPPAPATLEFWTVAVPVVALAATGLLLPRAPSPVGRRPPEPHTDLAWGGRAPAVVAGFGWMLCVSYSAGLLYWVTGRLGGGPTPGGPSPVVPPVPVLWAGLVFAVALLVLAATAARAGVLYLRLRRREYAEATARSEGPLSAHDLRRCRDVSAWRALHRLVGEHAVRLVGCYAAASAVLAALGCAALLSRSPPHPTPATGGAAVVEWISEVGGRLLGWLPVLIATVGLLVYRNDLVRRSVGVVWDVGTFWPRTAHPLAPPSYAERAVPELQTRTAGLLALPEHDPRSVDGIILSGHSQGTVICAAVILQLPARSRRRIWFLSYGCQLTRLYGRVFPGYFGPDRLPALAEALTPPGGPVRWTNFWRDTDPLGWPVTAGDRDVPVRDPEALHPSDGEVADPPIRNHSGYPEAHEFQRERSRVAWLLRRGVPAPRRGPG